jgi:hypothetical protein
MPLHKLTPHAPAYWHPDEKSVLHILLLPACLPACLLLASRLTPQPAGV